MQVTKNINPELVPLLESLWDHFGIRYLDLPSSPELERPSSHLLTRYTSGPEHHGLDFGTRAVYRTNLSFTSRGSAGDIIHEATHLIMQPPWWEDIKDIGCESFILMPLERALASHYFSKHSVAFRSMHNAQVNSSIGAWFDAERYTGYRLTTAKWWRISKKWATTFGFLKEDGTPHLGLPDWTRINKEVWQQGFTETQKAIVAMSKVNRLRGGS